MDDLDLAFTFLIVLIMYIGTCNYFIHHVEVAIYLRVKTLNKKYELNMSFFSLWLGNVLKM